LDAVYLPLSMFTARRGINSGQGKPAVSRAYLSAYSPAYSSDYWPDHLIDSQEEIAMPAVGRLRS
jgi:hypothetical protein